MMTKRRSIALVLLITWTLLAAGPVAFAATGKCCPVCTHNMCPMKKPVQASGMSCHDMVTQPSCHLKAGACSRDLDGLVFSFVAILPGTLIFAAVLLGQLTNRVRNIAVPFAARKLTPPPKILSA